MSFELEYINRRAFIEGQLKLYKIQFIETNDDKYLDVMNELNKTCEFLELSRNIVHEIHKRNKELETKDKDMTKEQLQYVTLLGRNDKFKINDKEFQCVNLGYDNCISSKKKTQGWYIKSLGDNGKTYFYSFKELYNKIKKYRNDNEHLIF